MCLGTHARGEAKVSLYVLGQCEFFFAVYLKLGKKDCEARVDVKSHEPGTRGESNVIQSEHMLQKMTFMLSAVSKSRSLG